jgi:GGDEF domain-containing protein
LWSSALLILLLPPVLVLISFQSQLAKISLFQGIDPILIVRASLRVIWIVGAITLYRQRDRLNLLRKGLIEQADAATKNRVRGEQFYGLSNLDPLTGLYNRRFGETRLTEEITRARESGDPLLLLAFDFDRFKQINDNLGHAGGIWP